MQTSEYSLQDTYKEEVTNTTENEYICKLSDIWAAPDCFHQTVKQVFLI